MAYRVLRSSNCAVGFPKLYWVNDPSLYRVGGKLFELFAENHHINLRKDADITIDSADNMRHYLRRICGE